MDCSSCSCSWTLRGLTSPIVPMILKNYSGGEMLSAFDCSYRSCILYRTVHNWKRYDSLMRVLIQDSNIIKTSTPQFISNCPPSDSVPQSSSRSLGSSLYQHLAK